METKSVIISQFKAALKMLEQAVERCPDDLWDAPQDKNKTWHIAYHALFYVHLYLQPTGADFKPWPKHREGYNSMGALPYPPHTKPDTSQAYTRAEVLEYLAFCREAVDEIVPSLDLEGASGFDWLPFGKLELQFYSLRHLMQHTGEICERLGKAGIDVDWVGMG
jgi:hypothetical protein